MMLNYNRFLTQSDLVDFLEEIHENEYEENFPHRDLWAKPDAMLKWISILRVVRSLEGKNLKVIDLGAGPASLPHIISSTLGHDVTAIDIADIDHLVKQSLVKMVLGDVLYELKNIDDESVDIFIDSCAVTHFKPSGNNGWKEVAENVYRSLKPGGKFIVSSDVDENVDEGEFIKTKNIIDIMEDNNLKITSPFEDNETDFCKPISLRIEDEDGNVRHDVPVEYKVVTLTFEK